MKKYDCDGGSIAIGTKGCIACFPNGYGDGAFSVRIVNTDEQRKKFCDNKDDWKYVGSVEGDEINVYSYDCLQGEELEDRSNILYTLSGRYGVYRNNGKIVLEQWQ